MYKSTPFPSRISTYGAQDLNTFFVLQWVNGQNGSKIPALEVVNNDSNVILYRGPDHEKLHHPKSEQFLTVYLFLQTIDNQCADAFL